MGNFPSNPLPPPHVIPKMGENLFTPNGRPGEKKSWTPPFSLPPTLLNQTLFSPLFPPFSPIKWTLIVLLKYDHV